MPQLKELKLMFSTGDLTVCEIDKTINGEYMIWVFSKSCGEWITLETQRTGNSVDDARYFVTIDAAVKVAQSIGFKADKLTMK